MAGHVMDADKAAVTLYYTYDPLENGLETRILHLAPGDDGDPLQGRLEIINLDQPPSYEALSYEWGKTERTQTILFENGSYLGITETLCHALCDLRHASSSKSTRAIWADAICINQDDNEERERQVAAMGRIYTKAAQVITYIGPEKDNSSLAIVFMEDVLQRFRAGEINGQPELHIASELEAVGLPPITDVRYKAVHDILLRGWSSRCWCAREFLSNENLILMCGRRTLEWDLLPLTEELATTRKLPWFLLPDPLQDPFAIRECIRELMFLRSEKLNLASQSHQMKMKLKDLMFRFHQFKATDPRDKVYAILDLAIDAEDASLHVDYGCSVKDLYTAVASHILNSSSSLEILYSVSGNRSIKLPSWVPDWSKSRFGSCQAGRDSFHNACGSTTVELSTSPSSPRLVITGSLIGRIKYLSDNIAQYYVADKDAERRQWVKQQLQVIESIKPYPHHMTSKEILRRTLRADSGAQEWPVHKDCTNDAAFDIHLSLNQDSSTTDKKLSRVFCDTVRRVSRYRSLCTIERGYFGAVPDDARVGDWLCLFHGGKLLFVIRESGSHFEFVGHAFVCGLMTGEVLAQEWYLPREFILI